MEILLAILVGVLYTAGVYMLLRRSVLKFILGIIFLSNATNLLVFLAAGLIPGEPVFLDPAGSTRQELADPLPQALVLTAVVIGFGIVVYLLAVKYRLFHETQTDDLDQLQHTEKD